MSVFNPFGVIDFEQGTTSDPFSKENRNSQATAEKASQLDLAIARKKATLNPDRVPDSAEDFLLLNPGATQENLNNYAISKANQDAVDAEQNRRADQQVAADEDRGVAQILKDSAISLGGKGALGIGQTAFGIADLVSRFNPVTLGDALYNLQATGEFDAKNFRSLDEVTADASSDGESLAQKFNESREILNDAQSDQLKATRGIIEDKARDRVLANVDRDANTDTLLGKAKNIGSDFIESVKDFASEPSAVLDTTLESLPLMLGPGAIAGQVNKNLVKQITAKSSPQAAQKFLASDAGKKIVDKIATRSGVGFTVVSEGISNGLQVQGEILSANHEDLLSSSPVYADMIESGVSPKQAKRQLAEKAGLITTGVAGLFAGVASKVSGAGKFEGRLFKVDSKLGQGIIAKTASATASGGIREGIEETAQGASGQFATNLAKQQTVNPDQDLSEGVVDAAAQGLVAGVASGGPLGGVASIPNNVSDGIVKNIEEAAKNTGETVEVRKAIATGNTKTVFKKDKEGRYKSPEDAVNTLLATVPEDKTKVKGHIAKVKVALDAVLKEQGDKPMTPSEGRRFDKYRSNIKALEQQEVSNTKDTVNTLITNIEENKAKPSKETTSDIDTTLNSFGNKPFTSKQVAKDIETQANTILKSGLANEEQTRKLESNIKIAKLYGEVTKDIFNGKGSKFIGINTYRSSIESAVESGSIQEAKDSLANLESFQKKHANKKAQLEEAFTAFKVPAEKRTAAQTEAIKVAEERVNSNGETFVVGGGTGGLIDQIGREVEVLNAVTAEMQSLVGTKVEPTVETPTAPVEESASVVPVKESLQNIESLSFDDIQSAYQSAANTTTSLKPTQITSIVNKLKAIDNPDVKSPTLLKGQQKLLNIINDKVISNNLDQELTKEFNQDTPKEDTSGVSKLSLLEQVQNAGLTVPAAVRKNPTHKKSIKILKAKLASVAETTKADKPKVVEASAPDTDTVPTYNITDSVLNDTIATETHTSAKGVEVNKGSDTPLADNFRTVETTSPGLLQSKANAFGDIESTIKDGNFTEKQASSMKAITKFHNTFKENLFKNFKAKPKYFIYKDPIQYFLKKGTDVNTAITEDDIDPNIVSAMAMVSLNWLATSATNTAINDRKSINSLLGRDSKTEISKFENDILQEIGTNYTVAVKNEIGPEVLKILGIKAKKNANGEIQQNLENSITNHAVNALMQMDLVTQSTVSSDVLAGLKKGKTEQEILAADAKSKSRTRTRFIRIFTDTNNEYNNPQPHRNDSKTGPGDLIDTLKDSDNVLKELFGIESKVTGPTFEKPAADRSSVVKTIRNSFLNVPTKLQDMLAKVQQTPYELNTSMVDMMTYLDEKSNLEIAGYDGTFKETQHFSQHKNTIGKNSTIINDYNNFQEFVNNMEDKTQPFYFKYQVWKSMRMGIDSNTVNPQASHMHRNMVGVKSHTVEIDTSNPEHNKKFLLGVAASMGIKTEKGDIQTTLRELKNITTKTGDPEHDQKATTILEGIEALQNRDGTKANKDKITKAAIAGGENHYSLAGLIAYADFLTARETKGKFKTNLYREPDGVTNGVAISLLQFVPTKLYKVIKQLKRVGIYTGTYNGYGEFISEKDSNDSYQDTAKAWSGELRDFSKAMANVPGAQLDTTDPINKRMQKNINNIKRRYKSPSKVLNNVRSLVGALVESNGEAVTKLGRDLVKNPLMITNYGAAISTVIETFANKRLNNIYTDITKLHKEKKFSEIESKIAALNSLTNTKDISVKEVMANPLTWKIPTAYQNAFKDVITNYYGITLEKAINEEYGEVIRKRRTLNKALNIAFDAFKLQYDEKYEAATKDLDGGLPSKETLTKINDSLLDAMPMFKAFFSTRKDDGILVMNRDLSPDREGKNSKTVSSFQSKFDVEDINVNDLGNPTLRTIKNGKGDSSLTLFAAKETWQSGGVAGPISGIHNIDASTMLTMLENREATNIHDAAIFDILNAEKGSKELNQAFADINKERSIMDEVFKTYSRVVGGLKKTDPKGLYKALGKANKDLEEFTSEFETDNRVNTENRKALFDQIKIVDNYTDGPNTSVNVSKPEAYSNEAVQEGIKEQKEDIVKSFGSDSNSDFIEDFQATQEKEITSKNTEEIFEDLGKNDPIKDSPEHEARLRDVLNQIVTKVVNPVKLFIQEKGNENEGILADNGTAIYMSNALPTKASAYGTRMSQREIYVHELMHNITHNMIDGNSQAARKLRSFYIDIRDAKNKDGSKWLTAKDFLANTNLAKTDPSYPDEIRLAQERYDYIFGDKIAKHGKERINPITEEKETIILSSAHHEFLTIGVTNEAFIKKLATYDKEVHNPKHKAESWLDVFTQFVSDMFNKFRDKFVGVKGRKADEALVILAGQLAGIDNRAKSNLWKVAEQTSDIIGQGFDKVAHAILYPFNAFIDSDKAKNSKSKIIKTAREVAEAIPTGDFLKLFQDIRDRMNYTETSLVSATIHEIRGAHKGNTYLHDLRRESNKDIDKLRLQISTGTSKYVREGFLTEITDEQNVALSSLLKTDIDGLFDTSEGPSQYDLEDIKNLYSASGYTQKRINQIVKEIKSKYKNNHHWYNSMAKSMGHEMATGRPIEKWSVVNAKIITDLDMTDLKPEGDMVLAEKLINELATLQAIQSTDQTTRDLVAEVIGNEINANKNSNGIHRVLGLHKQNKKDSLEILFKGQEKLFSKGYIKEQFSSNKSFMVAPASHKDELLKRGFTQGTKVRKDDKDPNQAELYMYTSNMNLQARFEAGIFSTTNKRAAGTDILSVHTQLGELDPTISSALDRPVISVRKKDEIRAITLGRGQKVSHTEGVLAPIFNNQGIAVDFRYKMDEATKKSVLGRDDSLDTVLGAMFASVTDKQKTEIINNKTVKALHNFYRKNPTKGNRGYTEVGPDSANKELREIYRLLPEDTRETIRQVWGGDSMFIKTEEATLIFGQREFNLTSTFKKKEVDKNNVNSKEWLGIQMNNAAAFVLDRKGARYMEAIWKEVIAWAKDAIVIKSGGVLLGNFISNTILLKTMGVSVKDIAKSHAEAFIGIKQHKKDSEELEELELDVKVNPNNLRKHKRRMDELKNSIRINVVTPLIEAGMFQPIVEDINVIETDDDYKSRINEWLDKNAVTKKVIRNTPDVVKTVSKNLVMAHDTAPYKFMRDMTQISDFVARYTLHNHNLKKGKSPKESIDMITAVFIDYTPPTHRYLQYANDMGFIVFTKFFFRIQRILFYLARERPGSLIASLVAQGLVTDVSDISDSDIFRGLLGKAGNPLDVMEEVLQSTPIGQTIL